MANTTANKAFRYPEKGDPATDVHIANLVTDFDIEVNSQLATRRQSLRYRTYAALSRTSNQAVTGNTPTKLLATNQVENNDGLADFPNSRFTASTSAMRGLYWVHLNGSTNQLTSASTIIEWTINATIGGATYVAGRQKRHYQSWHDECYAMVPFTTVGDYVEFFAYVGGTQTGIGLQFTAEAYKICDL